MQSLTVRFAALPNEIRDCFKRVKTCNRSKSSFGISCEDIIIKVGLKKKINFPDLKESHEKININVSNSAKLLVQ